MDFFILKCREINELSEFEFIQLISTHMVIHNTKFQCESCISRNSKQVRDLSKGCTQNASRKVADYKGQLSFYRCPANYYSEQMALLIESFRFFKNGILPYNGNMFEQPSKIIECFSHIENLQVAEEIERHKQIQKRAKNKR